MPEPAPQAPKEDMKARMARIRAMRGKHKKAMPAKEMAMEEKPVTRQQVVEKIGEKAKTA